MNKDSTKDLVLLSYPNPSPGDVSQYRVPYSLLYLERAIRALGVKILVLDEQLQADYKAILDAHYDRLLLVGVSSLTGDQIQGGIAFSKMVREKGIAPIVWGGWHPTLLPEETLRESFIDFVVVGQGERPLRGLVAHLRDGRDFTAIPSLGFKQGGTITVNPPAPADDTDSFPRIDLSLLDLKKNVNKSRLLEKFMGYFASHGCPLDCSFCCIGKVYHRRWYRKPLEQIVEELRYLKKEVGIDSVLFEDGNFFVNPRFAHELAKAMIDQKLDLKWETSAHAHIFAQAFSAEDVRLFAQSGCTQIYVGAESGDQEVLDLLDKDLQVDETLRFVAMLQRHGIIPRLSTMVCLPTDSGRDFHLTLDLLRRAKLLKLKLRVSVFFYTLYPETRLYDRAMEKGFVPPTRLPDWAHHTLRKLRAPWAAKGLDWQLEYFVNFYLPLADSEFYRLVRSKKIRPIVYFLNKLFSPIARLRLRANFVRFPVEAAVFLRLLHSYNRLTGSNFCLGNGSDIQ